MYKFFVFKSLSAGSIYKIILTGSIFSLVPLGLLFGIMGFFGADVVHVNKATVTGPMALVAGLIIGLAMAAFVTAFVGTACVGGLFLFSRFKPLVLAAKELPDEGYSQT